MDHWKEIAAGLVIIAFLFAIAWARSRLYSRRDPKE